VKKPNPPLEMDRREAALLGTLRGFAAPAAPQLAVVSQLKVTK